MFQTVFLNLSNHPAANWPPAQRAEAEALGGQIVDEPFPAVPPDADPEDVAALGDYTLQRILARAPVAAMVQGEFTLTVYLVQALEFRGILCYAATTRRIVENAVVSKSGPASSSSGSADTLPQRLPHNRLPHHRAAGPDAHEDLLLPDLFPG